MPAPETRARIQESVAALLEERSPCDLAVIDVMRHAGVSRTAFYRHYSDIYAVIAAMLDDIRNELVRSGDWASDPESVGEPGAIWENVLGYARTYAQNARLLAAMHDAAGVDERVHEIWWDVIRIYTDRQTAAIVRDQASGAVRSDLDAQATALALTIMEERLSYHLLGRNKGEPEDYARVVVPIWNAVLFGSPPELKLPR